MIEPATLFGLCGAALIGIGFYGFVVHANVLRRLLAFNVIGSGIFLMLGAAGGRAPQTASDPVPQALIITGIVVALSATALGVALLVAYARASGTPRLPEDARIDPG
jgi:multicomponent Na+:H+ antiporter subunit C